MFLSSVIIEVTCIYETSKEYLIQRKLEKEKKYRSLIPKELWQVKYKPGEGIRIAIRTMGTTMDGSHKALRRLGLINHCDDLQMITMNSSVILLNKHFSTGDFNKKSTHK